MAVVSSVSGMVFEEDGAGGGDAGACGEEGIAEDAEDPGLEVGAVLEGVEGAEGFGEGLLYEVFGFGWIAGEPVGVVVERGEERERELLEGCALLGALGSMADGMVRSASVGLMFRTAGLQGGGDGAKKTGRGWAWNILTVNRIAERLFHELFAGVRGIKAERSQFWGVKAIKN